VPALLIMVKNPALLTMLDFGTTAFLLSTSAQNIHFEQK
jgi:hypothetical protein